MNKYINYTILGFLVLGLIHCSPKTTEVAMPDKDKAMADVDINAFRKTAPTPGAAPKINIGSAESFDLENGLKVIVVQNDKIPQVSYQISLLNEQVNEGDKVGYVSMAGDMLARGTTSKTKAEIDEAVDFIGANMNTFSSGMFGSSLTKHSDKLLAVMTDVLYNPSFPEDELEKLKTQTKSGLESNKTDPNAIMGNVKSVVLYGKDHPYGEVQKTSHVDNITIGDLKAYYEKYFVPNNAYLIIVGDTNLDKAKAVANKYFSKWKYKPIKPHNLSKVKMPESTEVIFANKDEAVQSVVHVSYPVELEPGEQDVIPARLMNMVLGGNSKARLFQNLREDKGFTYGSYSRLSSNETIGSFTAQASVRNEVTDSSITQILLEMEKLKNTPVDESELQGMKNFLTGSFARSLESPQTVARFARNIFKYNLPGDYYETYLEKLNSVTVADIQSMAQKYIRPEKARIVVVGNRDEVADKLQKFDSDGQIDYYNPFGDKIDMAAMAMPSDVTASQVVSDYITALGGEDKLAAITSLVSTAESSIMGQTMVMTTYQQGGDKFAMNIAMGGMTVQEQVYDGEKVKMAGQGQNQIITEGPAFDEVKAGAQIIAQRSYASDGTELKLSGIEEVEGAKAYKVSVTSPSGKKTTEYYAVDSGLLIRSVGSPQEGMTVTTDFQDYQEVSGVMFPFTMKVAGMMPMTLEMKMKDIQVNAAVPEGTFSTE